MSHYMKIIFFKFWYKFLHWAIIHCNNLVTIHTDGIVLMFKAIEFVHCHIITHYLGFYHYTFFYKKLQYPVNG